MSAERNPFDVRPDVISLALLIASLPVIPVALGPAGLRAAALLSAAVMSVLAIGVRVGTRYPRRTAWAADHWAVRLAPPALAAIGAALLTGANSYVSTPPVALLFGALGLAALRTGVRLGLVAGGHRKNLVMRYVGAVATLLLPVLALGAVFGAAPGDEISAIGAWLATGGCAVLAFRDWQTVRELVADTIEIQSQPIEPWLWSFFEPADRRSFVILAATRMTLAGVVGTAIILAAGNPVRLLHSARNAAWCLAGALAGAAVGSLIGLRSWSNHQARLEAADRMRVSRTSGV
jgi:hypothetical protein